jgi:hypothetical protein
LLGVLEELLVSSSRISVSGVAASVGHQADAQVQAIVYTRRRHFLLLHL